MTEHHSIAQVADEIEERDARDRRYDAVHERGAEFRDGSYRP